MELEKTLTVAAPRHQVWALLLDPKIMAGCVPGTQAVEVLSDVEYLAEIKVKISFIAARFKIKTRIVESRPPDYLRIEGTGEDSSVASSMKQTSELFLTDLGDGRTEVRIKAKADVLGRLGSFGLSVMKTKADRMWDEFGANFCAIALRAAESDARPTGDWANNSASATPGAPVYQPVQDGPEGSARDAPLLPPSVAPPLPRHAGAASESAPQTPTQPTPERAKWWQRLVTPAAPGSSSAEPAALSERRLASDIYVEFQRPGGVVKVLWPSSAAAEAARWLKDLR